MPGRFPAVSLYPTPIARITAASTEYSGSDGYGARRVFQQIVHGATRQIATRPGFLARADHDQVRPALASKVVQATSDRGGVDACDLGADARLAAQTSQTLQTEALAFGVGTSARVCVAFALKDLHVHERHATVARKERLGELSASRPA